MSSPKIEISDQEILDLFQKEGGQERAFSMLVKKYQERLYWHIRRIIVSHEDTNDILQNLFIKVWEGLSKFRQDAELYSWLYRAATNSTLTYIDRQKKHRSLSISDPNSSVAISLKSERGFDPNSVEWKLQEALQSLPPKQRAVFTLRYYDDLSYAQMSTILGTSAGALKSSYFHAAKKIEEFILSN